MKALLAILIVPLFFTTAQAQYGGGTGEPNNPYLIYTPEQMNEIGLHEEDWDKHFKLMADIDLSAYISDQFNIIGRSPPFTGVFDGDGHNVSNFTYVSTDLFAGGGLFGSVNDPNAEIKNLRLANSNVVAEDGYGVGLLIAGLSRGIISNCHVENGRVAGFMSVGGLVGDISGDVTIGPEGVRRSGEGILRYCSTNDVYVSGDSLVGGLVGEHSRGTIKGCYSRGNVVGREEVGGLVGKNTDTIKDCFSTACVTGESLVGGLVGSNMVGMGGVYGRIMHCYSSGSVSGDWAVGGLVGLNPTMISNCFWDIETSGQTMSAGGTGKTTAEMQQASTFLDAGWDFISETANGTEEVWWILEGRHYPRLWWQYGRAFSPYPQDGAVNVPQLPILRWIPGGYALQHDVYFGANEQEVADATIESSEIYRGRQEPEITIYDPANLNLDKTYYWRIDEVNEADPNSTWKGHVRNFTTANFIVVDDFESYDALGNQIWRSWHDGYGYGALGTSDFFAGNGTGSVVGEMDWIEETIVHGGQQSMPYEYYNNRPDRLKYSEASLTLIYPHNWTQDGVSELSLWFRGNNENDYEPMYVAIANAIGQTAVVNHEDPNAVRIDIWTEWKIDLNLFADQDVDLTEVDVISIGFGDRNNPQPGGSGKMYFDDIRLYRPRLAASDALEVIVP